MPVPGKTLSSIESQTAVEPLPLFRPEAVAAMQQKFYGEIILIRPFSLMLLCWFALGITAAVFGFLFLGKYTEHARVSGIVTLASAASSGQPLAAEFYVPGRWIARMHPGEKLTLRCDSCPASASKLVGTVLEIPKAPLDPWELSQLNSSTTGPIQVPVYRITVSLQPQAAPFTQLNSSPQSGVKVEAEIPLGRKPLIKWFFERSAG